MKKLLLLMCMTAGLLSCNREIDDILPDETRDGADVPITLNISVEETKASKTAWADKDEIYVFFKGLPLKYARMTYNLSIGKWVVSYPNGAITSAEFSKLTDRKLTAVHFPVPVTVSSGHGFFFSSPIVSYYLHDSGRTYTVSGTTATATLSMQKPDGMVQIHVPGIQSLVNNYTFGCPLIRPVACTGVGADGSVIETEMQAGARLSGIADSDGAIFAGRLTNPNEAKDYTFTLSSDLGNLTTVFTLERRNKTLIPGRMYNTPAVTTGWNKIKPSDLCVDLGLSVKWMTYNVGASKPGERGWNLAWGELQPKNSYGFTNYLHWNGNDWTSIYLTKYTGKDSEYLQKEDDAVYAAWGGQFRMPTQAEWQDLRRNCTAWIVSNVDGVQGITAISKNGKSIFLPFDPAESGGNAYYWARELDPETGEVSCTYAKDWHLKRASDYIGSSYRFFGYFVRGVYTGIM